MAKYYKDSTELLKSIKRRVVIPESQNLFTDQDLLDFATEEIETHIVELINTQQENYFLVSQDVTLVAGQTKYSIPYRATGNKLKDLSYIDANGKPHQMSEIDLGEVSDYDYTGNSSQPYSYYTASNEICLVPDTNNYTGSLRFSFYLRTNALVPVEEVGIIEAIDFDLGTVTVTEVPEAFTATDLYDFVMERSPHKIITYDNPVTSVDLNTGVITFGPGNLPASLRVGDHVCLATQTAIPNVPSDLHNMVSHRAGARVLQAIGDTESLQVAELKSAQLDKTAANLVDNRVETAKKKIVNRNGLMRSGMNSTIRRWGK